MTALTSGHREGGCINLTIVGRPPCSRTAFCDTSHSGCLEVRCLRAHTAGSVISSLSPAAMIVLTSASIPPTWHTVTLFFWLLQVRLDRMPAAQVTMLTSVEPSSWVRPCIRLSRFSIFVPASERFLRVHKRPGGRAGDNVDIGGAEQLGE